MDNASFSVALAGLILSILNTIVLARQRSARIKVDDATLVRFQGHYLFLDLVLTNRSSLPLSVNSVRVFNGLRPVMRNASLGLLTTETTKTTGGVVVERRSRQIATTLPCLVEPYTSKHIVLEFRCRGESYKFVQSLLSRQPRVLLLELATSRGAHLKRCRFSRRATEVWFRQF